MLPLKKGHCPKILFSAFLLCNRRSTGFCSCFPHASTTCSLTYCLQLCQKLIMEKFVIQATLVYSRYWLKPYIFYNYTRCIGGRGCKFAPFNINPKIFLDSFPCLFTNLWSEYELKFVR